MQDDYLKPTKAQVRRWLNQPVAIAFKKAIKARFYEQEKAILEELDSGTLKDVDANQLKLELCVNQAIRAEQNTLLDADYILQLMAKYECLAYDEKEENDD